MKDKVLKNILDNNLLNKNSKVVVGVSGGADSVALLVVLNSIRQELGFEMLAVHINHNLRGSEAKRDENFVRDLCSKLSVDCIVKSVDVKSFVTKNKMTTEQGARVLRYQEFESVLKERNFNTIAIAHNANDQAETILMHLFRGAGIDGVLGMRHKVNNIIRPLIDVSRDEIIRYLSEQEISFVTDSTNLESKYTRNFIRNEILPQIEKFYPNASKNICKFGEKLQGVNALLNQKLRMDLIVCKSKKEVRLLDEVKELSETEIFLLIKECFKQLNKIVDVEERHLVLVKDLLKMQVGKELMLPHGVKALKRRGFVEFSLVDLTIQSSKEFMKKETFEFSSSMGDFIYKPVGKANIGDGNLYFDTDKLPLGAEWRNVQKGDKFLTFSGKNKLLSDFLTDKQFDAKMRKELMVLAKNSDVFLIAGVEISSSIKIDEFTKNIGRVSLINKEYC